MPYLLVKGENMPSIVDKFSEIEEYLSEAKGIAWDGCHKIYILMDDQEVAKMREYEYDPLLTTEHNTPAEMFVSVLRWYRESCGLRFIQVTSTTEDGTDFYSLVPQFFDYEEFDDEEEIEDDDSEEDEDDK